MNKKILTAGEAAKLVKNNSTIATNGFIGTAFAEELAVEIEKRFLKTGEPNGLTLVYGAGQGDAKEKGINHFGHEGLIKCVIGGHWGLVPKIQKLAFENKIEAYNLPQGVISHMFRDIAAKKPGTITHVGLNTFVDPRIEGGKLNKKTEKDIIELIMIDNKEYLIYKYLPIDFAILRGTTADVNGNVSMEREALTVEILSVAQAVKNSGGKVVVQIERIVEAGLIDPKQVVLPGILVDALVVSSKPEYHMQTFTESYNPSYCGKSGEMITDLKKKDSLERRIICRRAIKELEEGSVINLGIGVPEDIASVLKEQNNDSNIAITVESGPIGGIPAGGLSFGCSQNPEAIIDQPYQFDFYQGNGLDIAFLGLAQTDKQGDVNVSKFGTKIAGCGGFIDITQNAKKVVYCGTFTANGLNIQYKEGQVLIIREGRIKKFVNTVEQITFSGAYALRNGQSVLYITERAVFELTNKGMMLIEIAPGIDLKRDILDNMEFVPSISSDLKTMDDSNFLEEGERNES